MIISNNTVVVHIRKLREKTEIDTKNPVLILMGYKVQP
jgi:hypothetical protein